MSPGRHELAPGYSISRIINGGWQLSAGHGPAFDRRAVIDDLLRAIDAGFTTFDCADIYTGVEELLGEMLRRYRQRGGDPQLDGVQIHTKCVPDLADLPTLSRRDIEGIVDRSLQRLGVERLDLVQLHWWDYAVPGYNEAAEWLAELRERGKIRLLGATNFDTQRLAEIANRMDLLSHQVQYSLLDRRPERAMASFCASHSVHLLCYGTLAGGFLTAGYRGRDQPTGAPANRSLIKYRLIIDEAGGWPVYQRLLETLEDVAAKHAVSIANVATRWVLERPQVGAAIVGARGAEHLADNLRVLGLRLDQDDRSRLQRAVDRLTSLEGDTFSVERVLDGRHQRIMKTGLNSDDQPLLDSDCVSPPP